MCSSDLLLSCQSLFFRRKLFSELVRLVLAFLSAGFLRRPGRPVRVLVIARTRAARAQAGHYAALLWPSDRAVRLGAARRHALLRLEFCTIVHSVYPIVILDMYY